jgi:hypothetical protein
MWCFCFHTLSTFHVRLKVCDNLNSVFTTRSYSNERYLNNCLKLSFKFEHRNVAALHSALFCCWLSILIPFAWSFVIRRQSCFLILPAHELIIFMQQNVYFWILQCRLARHWGAGIIHVGSRQGYLKFFFRIELCMVDKGFGGRQYQKTTLASNPKRD